MRDPIPPPPRLVELTKPLAEKLSLYTLPWHAHEILIGFFAYHFVLFGLSPAVSRLICPNIYRKFSKRTQLNWDIHWVSMVQALFINTAALYVIFTDVQRKEMDWRGRLWGYTPASGMVQGFAAGYFLWDLQISAQYIEICGASALVHAIGALAVTCIGFVSPVFIEISGGYVAWKRGMRQQSKPSSHRGSSSVLFFIGPYISLH